MSPPGYPPASDSFFGRKLRFRRPRWWARGCTREVFLLGPWAVKLPSFYSWKNWLQGLMANMQEKDFSDTGWPELCPVVFYVPGGFLSVMKRAKPLHLDDWIIFDYRAFCTRQDSYAEANFDSLGEGCRYATNSEPEALVIPCENKMDSFGILDGRVVVVDYGN